jgi:hypothetical protein
MRQRLHHRPAKASRQRIRRGFFRTRNKGAKMSESNKMAEGTKRGMTATNGAILIAAFVLLAAAIGYAIWRDSASSVADPAAQGSAAPSDQLAELEARTKREPNSAMEWRGPFSKSFFLAGYQCVKRIEHDGLNALEARRFWLAYQIRENGN